MFKVDLNCDLGESFGNYRIGDDENVIPLISSANIACGFHASDPVVMQRTVNAAAASSVGIGAHPGYPDLMGFGRRFMKLSAEEAEAYVMYQIGALSSFVAAAGKCIQHVKPHGALYNAAAKDSVLADAICRAIKKRALNLFCLRFREVKWSRLPTVTDCVLPAKFLLTVPTMMTEHLLRVLSRVL